MDRSDCMPYLQKGSSSRININFRFLTSGEKPLSELMCPWEWKKQLLKHAFWNFFAHLSFSGDVDGQDRVTSTWIVVHSMTSYRPIFHTWNDKLI